MATTLTAPVTHAQTETDAGLSYTFSPGEVRRFYDSLDVTAMGVATLIGDAAGTGSDVLRVLDFGNVGWNVPMVALGTETDSVTYSAPQIGYTSITVAPYGLGYSESFFEAVLARPGAAAAIGIDAALGRIPETWGATIRAIVCTVIASFSSSVGTTTLPLTMDDMLDLVELQTATAGASAPISLIMHGVQFNQLRRSAQAHPNFQETPEDFAMTTATGKAENIVGNLYGLGMMAMKTNDVTSSASAYQGGAFQQGGVGWGRASTGMLTRSAVRQHIIAVLSEFGVVVTEPDRSGNGSRGVEFRAFLGGAAGASGAYLQRKVVSINE